MSHPERPLGDATDAGSDGVWRGEAPLGWDADAWAAMLASREPAVFEWCIDVAADVRNGQPEPNSIASYEHGFADGFKDGYAAALAAIRAEAAGGTPQDTERQ